MDPRKAPGVDGLLGNFFKHTIGRLLEEILFVSVLIFTKNGLNKGLIVKLDMSKVYDRVEWDFLKAMMLKTGFGNRWVQKVMNCVRTMHYIFKCNNTLFDVIIPERGLRQGDPLSPYLFLFCMEALSKFLLNAQDNVLRGIMEMNFSKSMVF
ncbi:hypothetical protein J1N35_022233 [Gossypium stocksii]|uniref:Reverse transcriptase domain-containing protein n=1 Tax=Gossypium stocksii TaxID=47602 RepID=A0A9D3VH70_9ROSI|nr:hypothetical protein J1N35_022233 [Gossypium stocksii]